MNSKHTRTKSLRARQLKLAGLGMTLGILFFTASPAISGVFDTQGRDAFGNLVVDSSLGDLTFQQAMTIANYLDTVDPRLYGLTFNQDSTDYYLSNAAINQVLVEKDQGGSLLSSIFGPNKQSQYTFTDSGQECSGSRALGGALPQTCLEYIPNAAYVATTNTLATVVQVTTISNTFNRPTTQFQNDIRNFTSRSFSNSSSGSKNKDGSANQGGGGAGDEYQFLGDFGLYFSGGGSFGSLAAKRSPIPGQGRDAFGTYNQTGTGAVDYKVNDWMIAGVMFNYTGTQNYLALNAGQLYADSYRYMPFLSLIPFENSYVDIMAGYGHQNYQNFRNSNGSTFLANYTSDQALASIDLGYNYAIEGFEFTGFFGGSYISTDVSGYMETGSGVGVKPYTVNSATSTVGTQVTYNFSTNYGVIQPVIRGEWVHSFESNQQITVVNPSGGLQPIQSAVGIRDWANITAGFQAVLPEGLVGFLNYQGQYMAGGQVNGVLGGMRMEF
jgi:hypothetical protein